MIDYSEAKTMAVLGSTGSIGTQTLDVARKKGLPVLAISAKSSVGMIEAQAREFSVPMCALTDEKAAKELKTALADTKTKVYCGESGLIDMIAETKAKTVVNAVVGCAGLKPTLAVIESGKRLALANKESLVVAGKYVMEAAKNKKAEIIPVDSEHCAIHQCLRSGSHGEVRRLILTASGGPFRGYTREMMKSITVQNALAHPTWKMGAKITIDSATMMNKGFEVIEAAHLFGLPAGMIDVVVHPQSIVHSMVEFVDNEVIAEMSLPDMRACIQYAVDYPLRLEASTARTDFTTLPPLTFIKPDEENFRLLPLARKAYAAGGALCAVLNAANEALVAAFLNGEIAFTDISDIAESVVTELDDYRRCDTLDETLMAGEYASKYTLEMIKKGIASR